MSDLTIRASALLLFVALSGIHHLILGDADGFLYYGSAALFDLFLIFILSLIRPVKSYVLYLQVACLAFIVANSIGWVMWYLYLPPTAYNAICHALYIAAIISVLTRGGNGRNTASNKLFTGFNIHRCQIGFNYLKDKGKA